MNTNIVIDVGPPDNKGRRLVIARFNGGEYRDHFATDSAGSRKRFVGALAAKIIAAPDDLSYLDGEIVTAADTTDAAIEFGGSERKETGRKTQATQIVELAADDELFHDQERKACASMVIGDYWQTWRVRSPQYRDSLRRRFFTKTQRVPGSQALQDALGMLDAKAVFEGPQQAVALRVAQLNDEMIYLDLGNERWEAVEVAPTGWRVVPRPPVRLRRAQRMQALPMPERGGNIQELWSFLNLGTDDDQVNQWLLLVGWLLMALRPTGPYPLLCLYGEQGSAKSTAAKMLRSLVDPNFPLLRAEPRDTRDLAISASNQWCLSLDNLSRLPVWLSDALCRLATGGGFSTRELYTDGEEYVFDGQRPVILNGITEIATRSDLMDRALVVTLPVIPDEKRRPESELWRAFEEARPRIFGALLDGVATALRNLPGTKLPALPRMADFALWATAAEPALGWPRGAFVKAYTANRADANVAVLETSPIVKALEDFLGGDGTWEGTASELLKALPADEQTRRLEDWPKSATALSNTLRRLAPNLRRADLDIEFHRTARRKVITLRKRADSPVTPVIRVTTNGTSRASATNPGPSVTAGSRAGDGLPPEDDEWGDATIGHEDGQMPAR